MSGSQEAEKSKTRTTKGRKWVTEVYLAETIGAWTGNSNPENLKILIYFLVLNRKKEGKD